MTNNSSLTTINLTDYKVLVGISRQFYLILTSTFPNVELSLFSFRMSTLKGGDLALRKVDRSIEGKDYTKQMIVSVKDHFKS